MSPSLKSVSAGSSSRGGGRATRRNHNKEIEIEALKEEVNQVIICLMCLAQTNNPSYGFGDTHKRIGINFSLNACIIAHRITGVDEFLCKMLNYQFRAKAAELAFERAKIFHPTNASDLTARSSGLENGGAA